MLHIARKKERQTVERGAWSGGEEGGNLKPEPEAEEPEKISREKAQEERPAAAVAGQK